MKSALFSTNPWPFAIIAFFAVFITSIITFIVFASGHSVDLVRKDYYEAEIHHQKQIDRVSRTLDFRGEAAIRFDPGAQQLLLTFPARHLSSRLEGHIHFYRPSDARLDHQVQLNPGNGGTQEISTETLRPGLWKVRVYWTANGEDFYLDQSIFVPATAT